MMWYFVRHGEIDSNLKKVYAGWSEEGLTEVGIQQAGMAGQALKRKGTGALYCSSLRRAVQTAEIIGKAINRKLVLDDHFREMKLGLWEGLSEDEIANAYSEEWRLWNTRPAELVLEGRETLRELQERVLEGIRRRMSEVREGGGGDACGDYSGIEAVRRRTGFERVQEGSGSREWGGLRDSGLADG